MSSRAFSPRSVRKNASESPRLSAVSAGYSLQEPLRIERHQEFFSRLVDDKLSIRVQKFLHCLIRTFAMLTEGWMSVDIGVFDDDVASHVHMRRKQTQFFGNVVLRVV